MTPYLLGMIVGACFGTGMTLTCMSISQKRGYALALAHVSDELRWNKSKLYIGHERSPEEIVRVLQWEAGG